MLNKGCVTYTCLLSDICAATSLLACVVSFIYREVAPLYATVAPPGDTGYATWRHRVRHGGATCRHLKNLAGRPYNSQHITEYTYHTRMVCVEDKGIQSCSFLSSSSNNTSYCCRTVYFSEAVCFFNKHIIHHE